MLKLGFLQYLGHTKEKNCCGTVWLLVDLHFGWKPMSWFGWVWWFAACMPGSAPWGFWEELAGAFPLVQSQLSSLLPAPAFFPAGPGCTQGRGARVVWSAPGCHLRLLSPFALPHQLESRAVTDVSAAPEGGRSRGALALTGVQTHAGCVPRDYAPPVPRRLRIAGLARDKQLPREMDILGTLI